MEGSGQGDQQDRADAELPSGGHPVCPRCGTAAGDSRWCAGCGLNLSQQAELPTADAYSAEIREQRWLTGEETRRREEQERQAAEERRQREEDERRQREEDARRQREQDEQRQAASEVQASADGEPEAQAQSSSGAAEPPSPGGKPSRWLYAAAGALLVLVLAGIAVGVLLLGGGGKSSPEDQVRAAWMDMRDAIVARDRGKFCSLLTDDARGQLVVGTALLTAGTGAPTCEAAMRTIFDIARDSLDKVGQSHLVSVTVDGDRATTTDSSGGSRTDWERVNGRWLLATSPDDGSGNDEDSDNSSANENANTTTVTTTVTTTTPTSPTPSPATTGPAAIITQHLENLDAGEYRAAFELLTSGYQSRNPNWVSERRAARPRINIISIGTPQSGDGEAQVPVEFYARDRNATQASDTQCRRFDGDVHIVRESGQWRYDPSASTLDTTVVASSDSNCPS